MLRDPNPVSGREGSQRPSATNGVKSEIKTLGIVALVTAIIAFGGIFLLKGAGLGPSSPTPSSPTPSPAPPQPSDTPGLPRDRAELDFAGWQTYRNDEFGFEVMYPPTWTAEIIEEAVIFRNPETSYSYSELTILPIGKIADEGELDIFGFFKKDGQYFVRDGLTEGTLAHEQVVNGMKVIKAEIPVRRYDQEGNYIGIGEGISALVSFEETYFLFDSTLGDVEIFDQILSTFRFVE